MSSIREQILRAAASLLSGGNTPASNVFRSQLDQIEREQLPCYDLTPGDEVVDDPGEYGDRFTVTRKLGFTVRALIDAANEGSAEGVPDAIIDDSGLDPFQVFAVQALCSEGQDFGGLAVSVEEKDSKTVFRPGGRAILGLELNFEVTFVTRRGDPTQKG